MKNNICIFFKSVFPYLCIAFIAFAIYAHSLNYDLTLLDDSSFINDAAISYEMSENILFDAFRTNVLFGNESTPFYRPILSLSFAIENKIAAESVFLAHLINILLHCLSSVLVLLFFRRYLSFNITLSMFAAMLFTLHPTGIQTVAWIPGRNDSIYFILFVVSFIFFLEYLKKNKTTLFSLSYLFFILACFTKESAILIPLLFIFYYILIDEKKTKIPLYAYLLWFGSIILFLIIKKLVVAEVSISFSMLKGLNADNFSMLMDHISAVLFFRTPVAAMPSPEVIVLGYASCIILIFFAFFAKTNKQEIKQSFFYLLLIFIMFLPNFVGDRLFFHGNRIYIPLFGILIIFFSFLDLLILKARYGLTKKIIFTILAFIVVISATTTIINSSHFKNGISFWKKLKTDTNNKYVTYDKFYTLALIMQKENYDEALNQALFTAKRSKHDDDEVLYLLAYIYFLKDNNLEAVKYLDIIKEKDRIKSKGILTDMYIFYTCLEEKGKAEEIRSRIFQYNNITEKRFIREHEKALNVVNKHKKQATPT